MLTSVQYAIWTSSPVTLLFRLTFDSVFRVSCTCFSLIVVVLKTASCVLEKGFSCAACQCASLEKCLLLFLMFVDELWYGCRSVCATRWGIASYSTHFVCWRSTTTPVFITFIFSLKAVQHWTHLQQKWNSGATQNKWQQISMWTVTHHTKYINSLPDSFHMHSTPNIASS